MHGGSRAVPRPGAGAGAVGQYRGGGRSRGGERRAEPVSWGGGAAPARPHVRVTPAAPGARRSCGERRGAVQPPAMQPPAASPGPAAPAEAELLRWQWREVQAPCLVAAWILVASLAKIGECTPLSPPPGLREQLRTPPGQAGWDAASPVGTGMSGARGATACHDMGQGVKWPKLGWSTLSAGLRWPCMTPHHIPHPLPWDDEW